MGDDAASGGKKFLTMEELEKELLKELDQKQKELKVIYFSLVQFYSETHRQDVAQVYLQGLLENATAPGEKASYLLAMGQLMEQLRDYPAAIEFYQKAFALEPADNEVWYLIHNNLGFSLNVLERYAEGERFCRKAIEINPRRHNAYKNLAISQQGLGDFPSAALNFIEAVKHNAYDRRAIHHLADLLGQHPELLKDISLVNALKELCDMPDFGEVIEPLLCDH